MLGGWGRGGSVMGVRCEKGCVCEIKMHQVKVSMNLQKC